MSTLTPKIRVTLTPDEHEAVQQAAVRSGRTVDAWIALAITQMLIEHAAQRKSR